MAQYVKIDFLNGGKTKINIDKVLFVDLYTDENCKKHVRIVYSNDLISNFTEGIDITNADHVFNLFPCHSSTYYEL